MERVYTIFISYSPDDSLFKKIVENQLIKIEDLTLIDRTMGPKRVEETIVYADFFLALLTRKGFTSDFLLQEIEIAKSMNKRIIAVVEVSDQITQIQELVPGAEFLVYEPHEPSAALEKIYETITRLMQRPMIQQVTQRELMYQARRQTITEPNLEQHILHIMSESRLKTFTSLDLAIEIGASLDDIQATISNLERNEFVRSLGSGYYSITYRGLDRIREQSRMFKLR